MSTPIFSDDLDALVAASAPGERSLPGVVAAVTDSTGLLYSAVSGVRRLGESEPMTLDTVLTIFSATKAVVSVALLQQVERGALDLDAPAARYLPELAEIQVLDGYTAEGVPILRPPTREVTTRMLMLHTGGFGYDYFNHDYNRLLEGGYIHNPGEASRRSLRAPLLFDPGERWEYGLGMDWAGMVLESVTGGRLRDVLEAEVLRPLGMNSTGFLLTAEMRSRMAAVHARLEDGSLAATDYVLPQDAEIDMAGHGLYSTANDYLKFLRMWLNEGEAENGRVLDKRTIEMASRNGLTGQKVRPLPGVNRFMTLDLDLFPDIPCSWALSFMVNDEVAPTGRPAGSLSWVGMANTFFWIDRTGGIAGFWSTQVLPLADPTALTSYFEFEAGVYAALRPRDAAELARR